MKMLRVLIILLLAAALAMAAAGASFVGSGQKDEPEEKNAAYYLTKAEAYAKDGSDDIALACYRKVLETEPENVDALKGQALILRNQNETEAALEDYAKLAEILPEDLDVQLARINLMIISGKRVEAKAELEAVMTRMNSEELTALHDKMFVKMPEYDLPSGSYDSYQLLHFQAPEGALIYYTTDGSEPSLESSIVQDKLIISYPNTDLKVKCINALGYESETLELNYEITVLPKIIVKAHTYTASAYALQDALDKNYSQPIYNYEAAQVTELYIVSNVSAGDSKSYTFYEDYFKHPNYLNKFNNHNSLYSNLLEYTPFLETLGVCWQSSAPWDAITQLKYLKNLSLLSDSISDISRLAECQNLEKLALGWNRIEDISVLAKLPNLTSLGLWNNRIKNIDALAGLTNLTYLDISNNEVEDMHVVSGMKNLEEFWGNGNRISDISPLDNCGNLRILMIGNNPLGDLSAWREKHPDLVRTDITD